MLLRHDRPDRDCIVAEAAWPAIVTFFGGDGAGTLIADRWLLTAAHTARNIPPEHRVAVGGRGVRIARVVAHPEGLDLALVELGAPVHDVTALALYEDSDEVGREVLLLGRGDFGNGRDGVLGTDHRLRCVTNRVDSADERWLRMRFDAPPDCTALEGVGGEGDSGGPAIVRTARALTIAGISSWQEHPGPLGAYGCVECYARVSPQVPWMRAVIGC
jgi:Trypsin